MGNTAELNGLELLDDDDKDKVRYFVRLLTRQAKYKKLKKEIRERKEEISKGDTLTHDEIWNQVNVQTDIR